MIFLALAELNPHISKINFIPKRRFYYDPAFLRERWVIVVKKKEVRIGFLGESGVGKSTAVRLIQEHFSSLNIHHLKLASPLYKAQRAIYEICQIEKDNDTQDGILLSFLGQHMRKINPNVIEAAFHHSLKDNQHLSFDLTICSDVRPIDVPYMRKEGFLIVNITANKNALRERLSLRGDLTILEIDPHYQNEVPASLYDFQIANEASLNDFQDNILKFIQRLLL